MFRNKVVLWSVVILASIVTRSLCNSSINSPTEARPVGIKSQEGVEIASDTTLVFYDMFIQCIDSPMPSKKFALENLKTFINNPSRTTVGYAPRFTNNRKFFANLLGSAYFKNMLKEDERQLRQNLLDKMKYCDGVVMDVNLMQFMYDREVDQTKI